MISLPTYNGSKFTYQEKVELIRNLLDEACLYDQLAEECSELIQAASKKSRKLRDVNPTPRSEWMINSNIDEELNDIWLILIILQLDSHFSKEATEAKLDRWLTRLYDHIDMQAKVRRLCND